MPTCTLCQSKDTACVHKATKRAFYRCSSCNLVFVPQDFHLSSNEEKLRYDSHQNDPDDERYRKFLSRTLDPLLERIGEKIKEISILDYGCGPGPAISVILAEHGAKVQDFDPFYANDESLLEGAYDLVTSTEVVEHFCNPASEFSKLSNILKPNGLLAVMTTIANQETDFSTWWYAKDPTHIAFYSKQTFEWIAGQFGFLYESPQENVIFLSKLS